MANQNDIHIWTIGHSTRTLSEFLDLLTLNGIEAVADVRSLPGSNRYPQFNAEVLAESLARVGIGYYSFKEELGGRRRSRTDSPNTVWRHKAFRGYADYMETPDFRDGVEKLLKLARSRRTAILCAEAVWWRCHRSMISDYLKASGVTVEHIMNGGKNVMHPYTSAAKVIEGRLLYGPE